MSRSNKPAPPGMETKIVAGDPVKYGCGSWPAKVKTKHRDGTFTIVFKDGREERVEAGSISYNPDTDLIYKRAKMCQDFNNTLMLDPAPCDWCGA